MNTENRKRVIYQDKYFILDRPYQRTLNSTVRSIYRSIKALYYNMLLKLAQYSYRGEQRTKKYDVSICAIFKDEGEFLKEWIEYHRIVGVQHFYLYNNNSSDNYKDVLKPYLDDGIITLIDWPENQAQMKAYNNAINEYACETKWMGFIDLDEFVVPLQRHKTVYDVLKEYESKTGALVIYWRCFGSSGLVQRDTNRLMTEQFTLAYPKYVDIGKCFYNTAFQFDGSISSKNSIFHHWLWWKWGEHYVPPINVQGRIAFEKHNILQGDDLPIQINHYLTKSYEDYYRKTNIKTDVYFKDNPRKMENFYNIDLLSCKPDYNIFRFMAELKRKMGGGG